jgi:hypothetical protein
MNVLAAKLILTPLLIAVATLAARRWGPAIGGWIAGLPLTSGPVSVFLAIEQGRVFAAAAAQATLLGLIAVVSFCIGYGRTANRLSWAASSALGFLFYFLVVAALSTVSLGRWSSILLAYLLIATAMFVMGARPVDTGTRTTPHSSWDLPLRMIAATGMVLLITAIAERIGPTWSGLLSPFPVFATVMAVFSHRTGGPQAAIDLLRGVVIGSYAFAAFFVIVALMIERWSILGTYLLAALVALLVNGISLTRILPKQGRSL